MESIFSDLYNSKPRPYQVLPKSREYAELREEVFRCSDGLDQRLKNISHDLSQRYLDIIDDFARLHGYEAEECFHMGLSMGLMLMAEAMGFRPKYYMD